LLPGISAVQRRLVKGFEAARMGRGIARFFFTSFTRVFSSICIKVLDWGIDV
jgi:hypothetical protein